MKYFPDDVVEDVKKFLAKYDLPKLDNNQYESNKKKSEFNFKYKGTLIELPYQLGLGKAYIASNYLKHIHINYNFLKYAWACMCKREKIKVPMISTAITL